MDWRTGRLSYQHMQQVLEVEYGGLPEALANLYTITGEQRYLLAAERFYHARVLEVVGPQVPADVAAWLRDACAPLRG